MDEFDYVPGLVPSPFASSAAPKLDRDDSFREIEISVGEFTEGPAQAPKISRLKKLIALTVAVLTVTVMLCSVMYMNTRINEAMKDITEVTSEIKEAQAENVRLHSELSSMLSADKVRNYAVSVLGMQKIERYQIHYFESRSGNTVVVADGKSMTPGA
ncbi:MAG: hypothetical protein IJM02_01435 [Clostridia bacterium]|nr:hypothetical protein [Clostridia bacterium]